MIGVVSRIVLRYLVGGLVTWGLISVDLGAAITGDADVLSVVTVGLSIVAGLVTEGWYWAAKRLGWAT